MKKNEEITLQDLLGIFLPKLWLIVLVAVVFAVVTGIYTRATTADTYTSSTKLCLYSEDDRTTDTANINAATLNTPLYILAVTENIFLQAVKDSLPEPYASEISISYLRRVIRVSQNDETRAFTVSVTDTDKERAFVIADTICTIANDEFHTIFGEKASKVVPLGAPEMPTASNGRGTVRNALVGGAVGFVLALLAVWLLSLLDATVRDKKKLEDNFDIPVIGMIPLQRTDIPSQRIKGEQEGKKA